MTVTVAELQRWFYTLVSTHTIAIDDDGLSIVELDENDRPTGAYYELGGVPEEEVASCVRCGNTDNDGSDTCPDCGDRME